MVDIHWKETKQHKQTCKPENDEHDSGGVDGDSVLRMMMMMVMVVVVVVMMMVMMMIDDDDDGGDDDG